MAPKIHKKYLRRISQAEIGQEKRISVWEKRKKLGMATPFVMIELIKTGLSKSKTTKKIPKNRPVVEKQEWYQELDALFNNEMSVYYRHRWILLLIYQHGLKNTSAMLRTKNSDICRYIKKVIKNFSNFRKE